MFRFFMIENRSDIFLFGNSNYIDQDRGKNERTEPEYKYFSKLNTFSLIPGLFPCWSISTVSKNLSGVYVSLTGSQKNWHLFQRKKK